MKAFHTTTIFQGTKFGEPFSKYIQTMHKLEHGQVLFVLVLHNKENLNLQHPLILEIYRSVLDALKAESAPDLMAIQQKIEACAIQVLCHDLEDC